MLEQCSRVASARSVGVFMALPVDWMVAQRGFDEAYAGWGHEDSDLWRRACYSLPYGRDYSGSLLIHQWHPIQPGAGEDGPSWPVLKHRIANPGCAANESGWGDGQISESVLRAGR